MENLIERPKGTMSRRNFAQLLLAAGSLGLVERSAVAATLLGSSRSMPWLATRSPSAEGVWKNLQVEGKVPTSLSGTLFRTAPGQAENNGTKLRHLFDGDAFLSAWSFQGGAVSLQARYLNTPQRIEESDAKLMLYSEYGTSAPVRASTVERPRSKSKNQPNVNIIGWNGKLLGLSEGGLPTLINPTTLTYDGEHDFGGSIRSHSTFTAHPRFCPKTREGYAWGVEKSALNHLRVHRIDPHSGKAETIYTVELEGFYMIHDAMLTKNYFVIIVPPTKYDMASLLRGSAETIGQALRYYENEHAKAYIFPRDNGGGKTIPIVIDMPTHLVFHHGNAYEPETGKIRFETVWSNQRRVIDTLANWKISDNLPRESGTRLRQVTLDLHTRTITETSELATEVEFPRFDLDLTGQKSRYLYATENGHFEDAAIVRFDLDRRSERKFFAGKGRTFGEPVFVSHGNDGNGWVLVQGFDAGRNETLLEIRDAASLELAARVWANGEHLPLGLHGNFVNSLQR